MKDEFNQRIQEEIIPKEYVEPKEVYKPSVSAVPKEKNTSKKTKKFMKMYMVAASASVVVVTQAATISRSNSSSSGVSNPIIVENNPSENSGGSSISNNDVSGNLNQDIEMADLAFPLLGNLEPNGIPSIASERLNEDYVLHIGEDGSTWEWVYRNQAILDTYDQENAQVAGLSYNREINTLTLDNFKGGIVECNLLGNSLKINLIGDNEITSLRVWGYYYGGSVTITGAGSLRISDPNGKAEGMPLLYLQAECSESALMIDETIEYLDITSINGYPIYVNDSLLEKNIYYKGLVLHGGKRQYMQDTNGYDGYMIEDGSSAQRHIRFDHAN